MYKENEMLCSGESSPMTCNSRFCIDGLAGLARGGCCFAWHLRYWLDTVLPPFLVVLRDGHLGDLYAESGQT